MGERGTENNIRFILNDGVNIRTKRADIVSYGNAEPDERYVDMPLGEAMPIKDICFDMERERTRLIIVVGPPESGKTTLEIALYQMFQEGQLDKYCFAGSKTLQAYEERIFYSRVNSGLAIPNTPRTSRGGREQFLHLRVYNVEERAYYNLYFADMAGEDYYNCIANSDEMKRHFPYFKRADFFVALLDGEKIADKFKRHSILENVKQMFRTIVDAHLCKKECTLQIATSKYDLLDTDDDDAMESLTYLVQMEGRLREYFQGKYFQKYFPVVTFTNIAAMPDVQKKYPCGFGLEALLETWCRRCALPLKMEVGEHSDFTEEFDRLSFKLLENW